MLGLGLGIPLHYRRRLGGSLRNFMFADISALLDASGYTYDTKCLSAALDKISSKGNDLPQIYFQYLSDFVVNLGYGFDPDCLWESFRQIFPFADDADQEPLRNTAEIMRAKVSLDALGYEWESFAATPTLDLALRGYQWEGFCLSNLIEQMGDVETNSCFEQNILTFTK